MEAYPLNLTNNAVPAEFIRLEGDCRVFDWSFNEDTLPQVYYQALQACFEPAPPSEEYEYESEYEHDNVPDTANILPTSLHLAVLILTLIRLVVSL